MLFHALDLGISVQDFWDMTPRGIVLLMEEMSRSHRMARRAHDGGAETVQQLNYIPRP